ncbi:MAG: hypothetical protein K5696_02335 [Lachnospiraceae bacterium]|nr:hypothetical protein [Lachnospiraceae bacterium]
MENTYVECMTRAKSVTLFRFLYILCIMLCAGFLLLGLLFANLIAFIVAIAAGVGVWFFRLRSSVEYEYQYIEKELSVDVIFNKSRRKHVASYDIDKMEIFAPIHSHHLDEYKSRQLTTKDYAAGEDQPDPRYVMIMEGKERLILEPSEGFVRAVRNVAPRKVFTE